MTTPHTTLPEPFLPAPFTGFGWPVPDRGAREAPANNNETFVFIEEMTDNSLSAIEGHWRMLEARALDGNAYFSPDFLLAAIRHFRQTARPRILAVWKPLPPPHAPRLIGLVPLRRATPLPFALPARIWRHPLIGYGAPLLDRFEAEAALAAILNHIERRNEHNTLIFPMLDENGATLAALRSVIAARGGAVDVLDRSGRAILTNASGLSFGSKKRSKELARLRRRLSDDGPVTFHVSETYPQLRSSAERFLALEAAGWKGQNGTALVQGPDSANFARAMLWSSARRDRARLAWLEKDGAMIAGLIILMSGAKAFLWKTAYDERYARFAPGSLLLQDLTGWLARQSSIEMTDSCAVPGQFLVETHWRERLTLCDVMVGLGPSPRAGFAAQRRIERLRRRLLAAARSVYRVLRPSRARATAGG